MYLELQAHRKVGDMLRGVKMKKEYIFPLLLIILDVGAAGLYAFDGDIKKAVYWIAAAVLNICVTF